MQLLLSAVSKETRPHPRRTTTLPLPSIHNVFSARNLYSGLTGPGEFLGALAHGKVKDRRGCLKTRAEVVQLFQTQLSPESPTRSIMARKVRRTKSLTADALRSASLVRL